MTYKKPEIAIMGDAARVIQQFVKDPLASTLDPNYPVQTTPINSAYDLDE